MASRSLRLRLRLRSFSRCPSLAPRHHIHIKATPAISSLDPPIDLSAQTQAIPKLSGNGPFPADVSFTVLGSPSSLLSIALPASTPLHTRRGTLLGLNLPAKETEASTSSTLSLLNPLLRIPLLLPFAYQKLVSTTPLTALVATNAANTTFGVISLDGTIDWIVVQRASLLAWSGYSLSVKTSITPRRRDAVVTQRVTGRGLAAVVGRGQMFSAVLAEGEELLLVPEAVVAYSLSGGEQSRPIPWRLGRSAISMRMQIPSFLAPETPAWLEKLRRNEAWRSVSKAWRTTREVVGRVVWGERVMWKFQGPMTVLLQSRTGRLRDVVTRENVESAEYANMASDAGAFGLRESTAAVESGPARITEGLPKTAVPKSESPPAEEIGAGALSSPTPGAKAAPAIETKAKSEKLPNALRKAIVGKDGKVEFQDSDFREFR